MKWRYSVFACVCDRLAGSTPYPILLPLHNANTHIKMLFTGAEKHNALVCLKQTSGILILSGRAETQHHSCVLYHSCGD